MNQDVLTEWTAKVYTFTYPISESMTLENERKVTLQLKKHHTKGRIVVLKEGQETVSIAGLFKKNQGKVILLPEVPILPPRVSNYMNEKDLVSDYTINDVFDAMLYEPEYVEFIAFCCRSGKMEDGAAGQTTVRSETGKEERGGKVHTITTLLNPTDEEVRVQEQRRSLDKNTVFMMDNVGDYEFARSGSEVELLTYTLLPSFSFGKRVDILCGGRMQSFSDPSPPPLLLATEEKVCDWLVEKLLSRKTLRLTKRIDPSKYKMAKDLKATFDMSETSPYLLLGKQSNNRSTNETEEEQRKRVRANVMVDLIRRRRDLSLLSDYCKLARISTPSYERPYQPHFFPFMNHPEKGTAQNIGLISEDEPFPQIFAHLIGPLMPGKELQFNYMNEVSRTDDEKFAEYVANYSRYNEVKGTNQEEEPKDTHKTREGYLPSDLPYVYLSDL